MINFLCINLKVIDIVRWRLLATCNFDQLGLRQLKDQTTLYGWFSIHDIYSSNT